MLIEIIALVSEVAGVLMIAFAAIGVHHRVLNEHKIDKFVEKAMSREQVIAKLGLVFVILGFVLNMHVLLNS